jgi:hypothetical protein
LIGSLRLASRRIEQRDSADRRASHDDKARALQMLNEALPHDVRMISSDGKRDDEIGKSSR